MRSCPGHSRGGDTGSNPVGTTEVRGPSPQSGLEASRQYPHANSAGKRSAVRGASRSVSGGTRIGDDMTAFRAERWIPLIIAGVIGLGVAVAALMSVFGGTNPPSPADCVAAWNAPANRANQFQIASAGWQRAAVAGDVTAETHRGCGVLLAHRGRGVMGLVPSMDARRWMGIHRRASLGPRQPGRRLAERQRPRHAGRMSAPRLRLTARCRRRGSTTASAS